MKTILVIEDHADMRRNVATILEMENFTVFSASDGRKGLEEVRRHRPDIILCDVMMPELDGYAVLAELRKDAATAAIPFIFLTAKGERRDVRTGMNLGADDYLSKPVNASDLLAAVDARMQRRAAQPVGLFRPDFTDAAPLQSLGLTRREAEVLVWIAQGKSNSDIATILETTVHTVKKHLQNIFAKLGVESRNSAMLRALEVLNPGSVSTTTDVGDAQNT
jgi:DNA-binding NarL/FixJ family response regulator